MQIQHFGNTFIRLQVKSPLSGDSIILIDPYETKTWGLRQPKTEGDIVLIGSGDVDTNIIPKDAFVATTPGEFETREIIMYGTVANSNNAVVFTIHAEDMIIGHVGALTNSELPKNVIELFDSVDVLFVPIGGGDRLDGKQAARVVQELEPRMVIPMYYQYNGVKAKVADQTAFLKELGVKKAEETQKLTIKKKDLPSEETIVTLVHL